MATRAEPHVVALDLGGSKLAAGRVDAAGRILERRDHETETSSEDALVAQLDAAIAELSGEGTSALGVGIPSLIDQRTGVPGASVNVPLAGLPLRSRLEERFGLPVALENDANGAAVAEHRLGAGRGTEHMILLTIGTGIGGGLILNGRLYRGAIGAAAELGHVTVALDGPACQGTCPGIGHLEALASGTAAERLAADVAAARPESALAREPELDGRALVRLAEAGDADARGVIDTIGRRLGAGVAGYVNVFNPEVVVI
ncbi:MAG TPA: ROK family protein, partial [Gaiellaceae bacterium]|nr:ROK family protein [Gaiellaceae bacterium]